MGFTYTPPQTITTWLDDLKKPVNLIGLIIGVVSLLISIFFWWEGRRTKEVTYQINKVVKIFDRDNSLSKIRLVEKDSTNINENVYLLTGKIWNSGNLPIDKKDVRKPVELQLHNAKRILDYNINLQTDSSVTLFTLNSSRTDNPVGANLVLDWNYFDPRNGFGFQIIYLGSSEPDFEITGTILDLDEFTSQGVELPQFDVWLIRITSVVFIPFLCFFALKFVRFIPQQDEISMKIMLIASLILIFLVVSASVYMLVTSISSVAPF